MADDTLTNAGVDAAPEEDFAPSQTIRNGLRTYGWIAVVGWCVFEVLRRKLARAYYCRARSGETSCPSVENVRGLAAFRWVWPLYTTSDDDVFQHCGLDTLFFLRFLRLVQKVAALAIVLSSALFPIYYYAGATGADALYRMTLSSLKSEEPWRFWFTVATMYIISVWTCYLLWREFQEFVKRRHEFMGRKGSQQYSVVLNGLPKHLSTQQTLRNYLNLLFPRQVLHVYVALECGDLEKLVAERVKVRNKLEHALALSAKTGDRVLARERLLGDKVDAIELYQGQLKSLNDAVEMEVRTILRNQAALASQMLEASTDGEGNYQFTPTADDRALPTLQTAEAADEAKTIESAYIKGLRQERKGIKSTGIMRGAGFVTFNSLKAAQAAQQVLQSSDPTEMHIEAAPHVDNVVWENIGVSYNQKSYWLLISVALTCAIILFWTIPTGFIVSLSKIDSLKKNWSWLAGVVEDNPWLGQVLEQVSPLMLAVMSALAPIIFGVLSKREGHATASQVTTSLLNKLVAYQVFLVFLLPIIGGTLIDTVMGQAKDGEDIKDIGQMVKKVSKAIPQQSSFFVTFLIVQTFVNLTLEFLRVTPLIKAYIYQVFAPKLTPRERASPWFGLAPLSVPGDFGATDSISQYYTVLIFVLVFCGVAPIMSYFALLYLFLSDVVYRWGVLCVYDPSPNSDGAYFPSLYRFCIGALIFSQVIIATLLGTKEVALPAAFSLALPFLTALFHLFVNARYPRTAMNLPLNECVLIDSRRTRQHEDLEKILEDVYKQPAMTERAPLEPDYIGLSSDPNENHRISSPPSEKLSGVFIMGDGSIATASPDDNLPPRFQGQFLRAPPVSVAVSAAKDTATTTHHTRTSASTVTTDGTIALFSPSYSAMHSPLAFSSIAVSQSERSRSSSYSSASAHALPKHLHQHLHESELPPVSASNPLPVLVHVKKERVLLGTLVFGGALAALTLVLARGVVVARFETLQLGASGSSADASTSVTRRARSLDDYNFYVGAVTALAVKPLLALVALVVPVALLCFATREYMQTQWSWRAQAAIFLVTNIIVWLLSNSLHAANVHLTASHIEPALLSADLATEQPSSIVESTSAPLSTTDMASARNTILRSAIENREQLEPSATDGECARESPRRLPVLVEFGFPAREWLRDVLPTAPAPLSSLRLAVSDMAAASDRAALPFARSSAQNLFTAALRLMDDFFRDPAASAPSNSSAALELALPSGYDNDDDNKQPVANSNAMETILLDAMHTKLRAVFSVESPLAHFTSFRGEQATFEFARYQLSPQIAFDAVTFDVPLDASELRRRVVLQSGSDTTQSVVYGNADGVFEMNTKEECSALGCVVSPRGERMSAARVDAGSQVHALAMCVDSATNAEDWHASVGAANSVCSSTSNRSALVFSFAKRIVGDELRCALNATARLVTLTNATKFYTVTVGRLAWTVSDLAETFHAACEVDEGCDGLTFPLQQQQQQNKDRGQPAAVRHVVVGAAQLPRARKYSRESRQRWATQLVGANVQEIDDGGALKSDLVLPRNFKRVLAWDGAVEGQYCEVERGQFLRRVVRDHLFSEHSLQPAYTAALFWLLQRAVVRDALTLSVGEASTTLAFSGNVEIVHAELSVPRFSAVLTCAGCAVLLLLALAVQLGGKRREAHIERFFTPHQLAQLVLGDDKLPRHLVKCDVLRVANDRLGSSEHLDEFMISGLALRHCKDPGNVLYVPKQASTSSSSFVSAA